MYFVYYFGDIPDACKIKLFTTLIHPIINTHVHDVLYTYIIYVCGKLRYFKQFVVEVKKKGNNKILLV